MEFILPLAFSIIAFTIGIRSFMEKGPLLNNAYIFASDNERKSMDKKPHYRQSATVFCLLGAMFLLIALAVLTGAGVLYAIAGAVVFVTLAYAIVSSVKHAT